MRMRQGAILMRSELDLFGMHIDFASRARRRWLVACVHAGFVAYLTISWFADQWSFSAIIGLPVFLGAAALIFARLTGRYRGKRTLWRDKAPPKSWIGRFLFPADPELRDLPDEQGLQLRDRAHFWSYHALNLGILSIWVLIFMHRQNQIREQMQPALAGIHRWNSDNLLFGLAAILLFAALTLPDSIILWFTPNMEGKR
jgi:hypothetical protein